MLKFVLILTCLCPTLSLAQTSQPTWQSLPQGQLIFYPFDHAPYPHASRDAGWKYQDKTFTRQGHYDDSTVGIFIPDYFTPGDAVNYVVHFHGWGNHVSHVIPEYRLIEQLTAARINAILLVPQGPKDASDSGGGKLELDNGAFEQLIGEVTAFLKTQGKISTGNIGSIILSTHSGGYKVTAAILDHGGLAEHIHDVLLLDSSYGSLEYFVAWTKASPDHRLISTYTDHLAKTNDEFKSLLDKAGLKYQSLNETSLDDAELAKRGVTFFHTAGPHDNVPILYFGRFLAGCELPKASTTQATQ